MQTITETAVPAALETNLCHLPESFDSWLRSQFNAEFKAWEDAETPTPSSNWFRMYEWERNGAWDSDWYSVIFHKPTGKLVCYQLGTTRFADHPLRYCGFFGVHTPEVLELAQRELARMAGVAFAAEDQRRVEEPGPAEFKTYNEVPVVVTRVCKVSEKPYTIEPCTKCSGTGRYSRGGDCFSCDGKGRRERFGKAETKTRRCIEEGTKAVAVRPAEFWGQRYAGGYNQPSRDNTRVLVRLEDGKHVTLSLNALRLDREPATFEAKHAEHLPRCLSTVAGDDRWGILHGLRAW